AAGEKIGERQLGERFVLKEIVAGVEKPGRAEIGEDEVFVVAQVFFNLGDVLLWVRAAPPKSVRAVALKERLEFQGERFAHWLRQHKIHPSLPAAHLAGWLKTQNILAERGEKVLRGGFGFDGVFEVEHILL